FMGEVDDDLPLHPDVHGYSGATKFGVRRGCRIRSFEAANAADIPCKAKDFRVIDFVDHGFRPFGQEDGLFTPYRSSKSHSTCIYNGRTPRATSKPVA